ATITSAGLNQRDGLPNEYIGEIMYLIEGYDEFYTLVDSTQDDVGGGITIDTFRPNAAGDETSIETQFPDSGSHYDKVDEECR
ncbi:hypothetical protein LCGC14_2865300, partial [marine sediment metagenome]